MSDELHASLTPNVVNVGETLEVEIDSSAVEWQNADSAIVRVFEVDPSSPFEPKAGKDKLVVTCEGTIADNTFTLTPAPEGKQNPTVSTSAGAGAPIVKLSVGGTTVDLPLPNKDEEQGVFELRIQLEIKKPKAKKFTSATTVMVRSFDHFTVDGERRPVVAFITGGRDDSYFATATSFWKLNADVVVSKKDLSLAEIVDMLDKEHDKFGNWGQINIIAHGRERSINIKLFADSDLGIHRDGIEEQVEKRKLATPPVTLSSPGGIDANTQIVMRACNAGRDSELIAKLHSEVFGGDGTLFVPKFVQVYQSMTRGGTVTANEWFEESLTFDTPGTKPPKEAELQAGIAAAWDALDSPGKGGDPDVEIPLFDAVHDWVQDFEYTRKGVHEGDRTKPDGTAMSDADLVAELRKSWTELELHERSSTWDTTDDRWELSVKKKTEDKKAARGYFVLLKAGKSDHQYEYWAGGWVSVGSTAGENIWVVEAEGVADFHFNVELGPGPKEATIHDGDSGEPTLVGKTKLVGGATKKVSLPVTIKFGKGELHVREGQPPIDIEFEAKRHHVDRRRQLRLYDPDLDYADRQLVIPTVGNSDHYGSS